MFGGNFKGRGQMGGAGLRFRGSSSPHPYIGRGRGGLPRCGCYVSSGINIPAQGITREQEISFLKGQTQTIKKELDMVASRIRDLETGK